MTDLVAAAADYRGWVEDICGRLDVPTSTVDVVGIHALTGAVAAGVSRPMAPVTAFIAGLAVGSGRPVAETFAVLEAAAAPRVAATA